MLTCTQIIQTKREKFLCKTTVLMCVSSFESFGPSSELDNDVCWKKTQCVLVRSQSIHREFPIAAQLKSIIYI